ncbi:MAG: hypothetical protein HMLKMBBP_03667 [Planctomycetes bacterium]|nr:hypothetical protein [Planctomycetota bacterium]
MGTLLSCTACTKEMVIEPVHAGRTVPCPWCRKPNDVPTAIDFAHVSGRNARDEVAGGWLLAIAIVGLLSCMLGLVIGGIVWWIAQGRIAAARDEGRPVDPNVGAARTIAVISVVTGALFALIAMQGC